MLQEQGALDERERLVRVAGILELNIWGFFVDILLIKIWPWIFI